MREIIALEVGSCGINVGASFWREIAREHKLDFNGHYALKCAGVDDNDLKNIQVYFSESRTGRYVPRNLFVDLENKHLDGLLNTDIGPFFRPDSFFYESGLSGANNWARGYNGEGLKLSKRVEERLRLEVECCEKYQGFQLIHGVGGGAGGGLGSRLLTEIKDNFTGSHMLSFSVFPHVELSEIVIDPYNSILTAHRLIENSNQSCTFENKALFDICQKKLGILKPTLGDVNTLLCLIIDSYTSSLRFNGLLNVDLRKLAVNLVPQPRQHFFLNSFAPLIQNREYHCQSVQNLTTSVFNPSHTFADVDVDKATFIACGLIYRGEVSAKKVDEAIFQYQEDHSQRFLSWMPSSIVQCMVQTPACDYDCSCCIVMNSTAITKIFQNIHDRFDVMFQKNAFIHWYLKEGMEDNEFMEASSNTEDLVHEYETNIEEHEEDEHSDDHSDVHSDDHSN